MFQWPCCFLGNVLNFSVPIAYNFTITATFHSYNVGFSLPQLVSAEGSNVSDGTSQCTESAAHSDGKNPDRPGDPRYEDLWLVVEWLTHI